jgi:hypothetical protein
MKGVAPSRFSVGSSDAFLRVLDVFARRYLPPGHPVCRRPTLWGAGPPAVVMVEHSMTERPSPPPAALLGLSWDVGGRDG